MIYKLQICEIRANVIYIITLSKGTICTLEIFEKFWRWSDFKEPWRKAPEDELENLGSLKELLAWPGYHEYQQMLEIPLEIIDFLKWANHDCLADNHKMLAQNQLSLFSLVTSYLFFAEPENKSLPDSSDLVNPCCHSLCHHYPQSGDGWVPVCTFLILWHRWLQQKHTAAGLHRFPRLCSSFSFCPSSDFSLSSDLPSLSGFGGSVLGSVNWQQQQIQNLQHSALGHMG